MKKYKETKTLPFYYVQNLCKEVKNRYLIHQKFSKFVILRAGARTTEESLWDLLER
ncbi:hypothetical protein [Helicobacter marmotae]|uniref:hypothetical protein n=1 Tax=Helicobacter marmotae TaxID=152490 RepID=UPI0013151F92|nr:hypothetical protein [Helicobacter marmotae]